MKASPGAPRAPPRHEVGGERRGGDGGERDPRDPDGGGQRGRGSTAPEQQRGDRAPAREDGGEPARDLGAHRPQRARPHLEPDPVRGPFSHVRVRRVDGHRPAGDIGDGGAGPLEQGRRDVLELDQPGLAGRRGGEQPGRDVRAGGEQRPQTDPGVAVPEARDEHRRLRVQVEDGADDPVDLARRGEPARLVGRERPAVDEDQRAGERVGQRPGGAGDGAVRGRGPDRRGRAHGLDARPGGGEPGGQGARLGAEPVLAGGLEVGVPARHLAVHGEGPRRDARAGQVGRPASRRQREPPVDGT